ncbi:hypothetical protein GCM10008986_17040 [Salinibacillus aidingensis]|uniref:Uncharacterized protein n=1 Tax=Salinibacillus aidingensis TaxID=237684 RepID=A0ABP3L3K0_9BACI
MYERVVATTIWPYVYHYSRARYESWTSGEIIGDSGRVWGWDQTEARSGYAPTNFYTAHTYWGR